MTSHPLDDLPEHLRALIEAEKRAFGDYKFAEGYAKAKLELGTPTTPVDKPAGAAASTGASAEKGRGNRRKKKTRPALPTAPRGSAPKFVEDHLRSIAPQTASLSSIVKAVAKTHGVKLAIISVKRAVQELESQGKVERVGEDKLWRWVASSASPALRAVS